MNRIRSFTTLRLLVAAVSIATMGALLIAPAPGYAASLMVVNGTADDATVANLNGNGTCDLREAIQAANTNTTVGECVHDGTTVLDTIHFNIPGTGPHQINVVSGLTVTSATQINGLTQPGFVDVPLIRLNATCTCHTLILGSTADSSVVRGLMFTSTGSTNTLSSLAISGADFAKVWTNYFGTDGTSDLTVQGFGVNVGTTSNVEVGGTLPGQGNLISGYHSAGILIDTGASSNNLVQSNMIGTNSAGTGAIANAVGIKVQTGTGNTIGGTGAGKANLISGNDIGIQTSNSSTQSIDGNWIGVQADHTSALPNTTDGIRLGDTSATTVRNNVIANHNGTSDSGLRLTGTATLTGSSNNNCFLNNTFGANNTTGVSVNLENNWWGDATGPNPPGSGDPISANVDADPFLTTAPAICPEPPVVNLLTNGSMEDDILTPLLLPDFWKGNKLKLNALKDGRVCDTAHDGACSMRIVGSGKGKTLTQQVTISGSAGDSFTLTFWALTVDVPSSGGSFRAQVKVWYTNGKKQTFKFNIPAVGDTSYTKYTVPFSPTNDYKKMEVYLQYARRSGTVWFDDVILQQD
jgi:CSLREA domain-containing protein